MIIIGSLTSDGWDYLGLEAGETYPLPDGLIAREDDYLYIKRGGVFVPMTTDEAREYLGVME
jgi:hypothetical protein